MNFGSYDQERYFDDKLAEACCEAQRLEYEAEQEQLLRKCVNDVIAKLEIRAKKERQILAYADRGARQTAHLKKNASIGGQRSAHYKDAEVTAAFTDYKRKNPAGTAWDASNALIREGKALDKYKAAIGPWKRIGRIAEKQFGVTTEEWYGNLA